MKKYDPIAEIEAKTAKQNNRADEAKRQIARAAEGPGCLAKAFAWTTNLFFGVIVLVAVIAFIAITFAPGWVQLVFNFPGG